MDLKKYSLFIAILAVNQFILLNGILWIVQIFTFRDFLAGCIFGGVFFLVGFADFKAGRHKNITLRGYLAFLIVILLFTVPIIWLSIHLNLKEIFHFWNLSAFFYITFVVGILFFREP